VGVDKERFDKDLEVGPEVDEHENDVEEVEPPDLAELEEHLQASWREHEASDDYSEEPKIEVSDDANGLI
jgi:hypothetical protein